MNLKTDYDRRMPERRTDVNIEQLRPSTNIRDCSESLWRWLEMKRSDVQGYGLKKIPLIGDLPFEVWKATSEDGVFYGTSWDHATQNACDARDARILGDRQTD